MSHQNHPQKDTEELQHIAERLNELRNEAAKLRRANLLCAAIIAQAKAKSCQK